MRPVPFMPRSTAASGPLSRSRCSSSQVAAKPARRRSVQARARSQGALALGRYADHRDGLIGIGSPWKGSAWWSILQWEVADVRGFARSDSDSLARDPPSVDPSPDFGEHRIL